MIIDLNGLRPIVIGLASVCICVLFLWIMIHLYYSIITNRLYKSESGVWNKLETKPFLFLFEEEDRKNS